MSPGVSSTTSKIASTQPSENWTPTRPNILLTGTPGVGKSTVARDLAERLGLRHIDVGQFARDRDLYADFDEVHDCYYMHEDAVLDELEPIMKEGAVILDHHSCDWYPERWIQLAVVLSSTTEVLYDRLEARGYSQRKLQENVEAEIMQVVYEEAITSYPRLQVLRLQNDSDNDLQTNVASITRAWNALNRGTDQNTVDGPP